MGAGAVEAGDAERVLAALEARAAGAAPPPPGGLADWRRCPKFHHAVSALAGWAGAGGGGEAAARVQALERELRGLQAPAFCRPPAAAPRAAAPRARGLGAGEGAGEEAVPGVRWRPGGGSGGLGAQGAAAGAGLRLSRGARAELDQHSAAREALTDDLVGLAAGLRRNAEAMAQRAGEGRGLMDRTEQLLEGNLARAGAANADAKAALSRGWWRGIGTKLGMLLTVGLAFLGIYLFLKASSMAGYSHQAAPSSSAAGAAPPPPPRLDPATVPPEAPPGAVGPAPPEL